MSAIYREEKNLYGTVNFIFNEYKIFNNLFNNSKEMLKDLIDTKANIRFFEDTELNFEDLIKQGTTITTQFPELGKDPLINSIINHYEIELHIQLEKELMKNLDEIEKVFTELNKEYKKDIKGLYIVSKYKFYKRLIDLKDYKFENIRFYEDIKDYKELILDELKDDKFIKKMIEDGLEIEFILTDKLHIIKTIKEKIEKEFIEKQIKNPKIESNFEDRIINDGRINRDFIIFTEKDGIIYFKEKDFLNLDLLNHFSLIYNNKFLEEKRRLKKDIEKASKLITNKKTKKALLLEEINNLLDDNTIYEDYIYIVETYNKLFSKSVIEEDYKDFKKTLIKKIPNFFESKIEIEKIEKDINEDKFKKEFENANRNNEDFEKTTTYILKNIKQNKRV